MEPPLALEQHDDALVAVAHCLHDDDVLCFALSCRSFLRAVRVFRWKAGTLLRTPKGAAFVTVARLSWVQTAFPTFSPAPPLPWLTKIHYFFYLAARRGSQSVLDMLQREEGSMRGAEGEICAWAARGGQLAMLQGLHAQGCPLTEATCMEAAAGGHLEVLHWAQANGCPWDEDACYLAGEGHDFEESDGDEDCSEESDDDDDVLAESDDDDDVLEESGDDDDVLGESDDDESI
mmetsp:Transcript_19450/g.57392  ORF Transcript_19450/g.57392 Transcript_19450/m.57392 type:complete len:234 (-) Transcript_19450:65-766(-)